MTTQFEMMRGCLIMIASFVSLASMGVYLLFSMDQDGVEIKSDMGMNMAMLFNVVSTLGIVWMIFFWRQ